MPTPYLAVADNGGLGGGNVSICKEEEDVDLTCRRLLFVSFTIRLTMIPWSLSNLPPSIQAGLGPYPAHVNLRPKHTEHEGCCSSHFFLRSRHVQQP